MKKFFYFTFLLVFTTSCSQIIFSSINNTKNPFKKKTVWVKDDREIIHIPMIHIAKKEFYDKVKAFVDEKHKEGYVVYFEGITNGGKNQEEKEILNLKFRKLVGFHLEGAYNNENNKSTPKFFKKYTAQTLTNTGVDTLVDIHADMSMKQIIEKLEAEIGKPIELDSCDYKTPLNAKYECKNYYTGKYSFEIQRGYRDDFLVEKVLNSLHKKIIVLYGANHKWTLYPRLQKAGFKLKEGKWYGENPKKIR